jgi:hypothetical protein
MKLENIDVIVLAYCILDSFYSGNLGTDVLLLNVSILKIFWTDNITLGLRDKPASLMN